MIITEVTSNRETNDPDVIPSCEIIKEAEVGISILYTPPTDSSEVGETEFCDYIVCIDDGSEKVCDTARVTIKLKGGNKPPNPCVYETET